MDEFSSMRYAHSDGYTDICFDESGDNLITCGTDGDIRIYNGFDDDDPQSQNMGKVVTAIALKNKFLYVATDVCTVSAYNFPQFEFDGIIAQYNSAIYHIVCSANGNFVASGGGDFIIKVYEVFSKNLIAFRGHDGPILSIGIDAEEKYLASSACDGTVRVWQLSDQKCMKTLKILKKCKDFSASSSISRLNWSPNGQIIAIPVEKEIWLYQRDTWECVFSLKDESIIQDVSVASFSPFGTYLAGCTIDGQLVVWDIERKLCVSRKSHEKKVAICSFAWNPSGKDIAFCDIEGQMGIFENPFSSNEIWETKIEQKDIPIDFECEDDKIFDDDDNDVNDLDLFHDKDDENAFDIGAIKATLEPKIFGTADIHDDESVKSEKPDAKVQIIEAPKPLVQKSFQPTSTPVNLERRFMLWNTVGIVRSYNTEEENSIDVEFHDTNVYHPLHLNNTRNHTLAALSTEALLLASPKADENSSKLECLHFGTWDSNKEWIVEMPENEGIESITLGEGFAVCITDKRFLRIFTVSGVQCEVISIPGPVVCSAAKEKQVIIAYHKGLGIENDQCLSLMVVNVKVGDHCVIKDYTLPLSPSSFLSWLGYTDEGHPCIVDTTGVVNLLSTSFGIKWTPICNTRNNLKGISDTYFVIGLSEIKQEIRCIMCKGSKYPSLLPKPTVAVLPFSLPFCEMSSDKGILEEENRRCSIIHKHLEMLLKEGYDIDSEYNFIEKKWMDILLKMFALATRTDREYRALNIAELMPNTIVIQGAIKYATQRHRIALAERLGEVLNNKLLADEEEIETNSHSESESINSQLPIFSQSPRLKNTEEDVILRPKPLSQISKFGYPRFESSEQTILDSKSNAENRSSLSKSSPLSNPFKANFRAKLSKKDDNCSSDIDSLLDSSMKNLNKSNSSTSIFKTTKKKSPEHKKDSQSKLSNFQSEPQTEKFGFRLFFEENKSTIQSSSESVMNESELIRAAMKLYKELPLSEKQKYSQQSKKECLTDESNDISNNVENCEDFASTNEKISKRKENFEIVGDVPKPKKLKSSSNKVSDSTMKKLTQFAFSKRSSNN